MNVATIQHQSACNTVCTFQRVYFLTECFKVHPLILNEMTYLLSVND